MSGILQNLIKRGCIHDISHSQELEQLLQSNQICFYCGFDPTASSLHVGHMLPLVLMRRFQKAGHKPLAIIGSATGMIGDPSGKSEERKLLNEETVLQNVASIRAQIKLFLNEEGVNGCQILCNDQWLKTLGFIDFLRDIGKHFTINSMIAKESVKMRLEGREQGISYTEFSYMLLQAYDFYYLNKNHRCVLQVGGSDQWGNITAGIELIRRKNPGQSLPVFGLTFPLVTTSSGTKFGKTEKGAVWLAADKTSPYQFYQYWLNTADTDAIKYLLLFTEVNSEEISHLETQTRENPQERLAQRRLAEILTTLVHGADETTRAESASKVLFGGSLKGLDSKTLVDIFTEVPSYSINLAEINAGTTLPEILVLTQLADSKGSARRLIEGGGVYVNNEKTADVQRKITVNDFIDQSILVLRSGKKKYSLVKVAPS